MLQNARNAEEPSLETAGEYKVVLDEMADAMNHLAEETHSLSRVGIKRQKRAGVAKDRQPLWGQDSILMDRRLPSVGEQAMVRA